VQTVTLLAAVAGLTVALFAGPGRCSYGNDSAKSLSAVGDGRAWELPLHPVGPIAGHSIVHRQRSWYLLVPKLHRKPDMAERDTTRHRPPDHHPFSHGRLADSWWSTRLGPIHRHIAGAASMRSVPFYTGIVGGSRRPIFE